MTMTNIIPPASAESSDNPGYQPGHVAHHTQKKSIAQVCRALRATHRPLVLVPTAGGLHDGSLALTQVAARYPRSIVLVTALSEDNSHLATVNEDLQLLQKLPSCPVSLFFTPCAEELFPTSHRTTLSITLPPHLAHLAPPHLGEKLRQLLTLLHIVSPQRVVLGECDLITAAALNYLCADLHVETTVHTVGTLRGSDGSPLGYAASSDPRRDISVVMAAALTAGVHAAAQAEDPYQSIDDAIQPILGTLNHPTGYCLTAPDLSLISSSSPPAFSFPVGQESRLWVWAQAEDAVLYDTVSMTMNRRDA